MADPQPEAERRVRRRLLLVAAALATAWTVMMVVTGAATGVWQDERPPGVRLAVGVTTIVVNVVIVVAYRRISRPVGDLLGAAEQMAIGDYAVQVPARGLPELRLLATTLNEMASRLTANEEQRRRFLADITHELRNPLAVLQSEIEAQLDGIHPRDDSHLASLLDETRRLGHLVDDLHTLALAETGRLVLQHEAVTFSDVVDDVVTRHQAQAEQREVVVRAVLGARLPKVWVDPARIRQVLDNLLANAIRHTPSGGEVVVEVSAACSGADDRPMVRCRVTDAGPGFSEDQLTHMFERFQRAGDLGGSGLGLSIARDLVLAHGGTIDAGNDAATGGATVSVTLPA
jgi:two-component system sensor histidine kinase BaeS